MVEFGAWLLNVEKCAFSSTTMPHFIEKYSETIIAYSTEYFNCFLEVLKYFS